ncbi:TetR/AcrR family transcriptional regulator [Shewanella youngdeokensis]|uniref:Helix-turn-helix domain-containing protein n=1 Tax=Shewanella youngdeokensis TaxID=2999068 RepID=A0ABZ0K4E6_9GAMM|nr:helix-turn-helix domain-containing protein [Shewanella sp. DAU334]
MGKYRKVIIKAARKLIIDKGIFDFSMRDLVNETTLSTGTVYREVRNKEDILVWMFAESVGASVEQHLWLDKDEQLTAAEKIVCAFGYAAYAAELFENPTGTNFLGSNFGLIRRASQDAIDGAKLAIAKTHAQSYELFKKNCFIETDCTDELIIREAFSDLLVIGRGLLVLNNSFVYKPDYITVQKLCRLSRLVLAELSWHDGQQEIDDKKVNFALKTLLDNTHNPLLFKSRSGIYK